jgi:hypothetical protein
MNGYGAAGCGVAAGCGALAVTGFSALTMGMIGAVLMVLGLLLVRMVATRQADPTAS